MSTASLNRIVLKGFRSIREMDIELKPINLLIGANGAGKSNFLSFFKFARELQRKSLQFYVQTNGGADKFLFFGRKRTPTMECRIEFSNGQYATNLSAGAGNRLYFSNEHWCVFDDAPKLDGLELSGLPGGMESSLPAVYSTDSGHEISAQIDSWRVYHFHDTSPEAKVKLPGGIDQTDSLRADASNLAAFLRSIRTSNAYSLIVRTIQRVAPYFVDFVLEPQRENEKYINLRWTHAGSDDIFDAADFSDGTLRFICLTTLLLQPDPPKVVVLDEPELGLHPFALTILAGIMRSISIRTQIVAATQSVTFANQFAHDDIIVVDRVDEASTMRRLTRADVEPWLGQDYGIGDLWEKNIIGGTP
ncbi:AAA family ATPase [Tahibacter soli]|uniref:AAA family ATPase n=1 Tax=Tahibacter soli TaxID=2983605 RepID=A0A9X3YMS4_9GAMM|nr:AAA family ATPase [Tahibacter soli]MDC8014120.1 AAA family ATPase [Tahibacter soli]